MAKLTDVYTHLVRRATASGADQAADLAGGARIAVRVRDGQQIVTFSRTDKRLGDTELMTFVRHCQIPSAAARLPARMGEQGRKVEEARIRYWVAFVWSLAEPAQQQTMRLTIPAPARVLHDDLFPEAD